MTDLVPLYNHRYFRSILERIQALQNFRSLYNPHGLIERLGFQSQVQAALESAARLWWALTLSRKSEAAQDDLNARKRAISASRN